MLAEVNNVSERAASNWIHEDDVHEKTGEFRCHILAQRDEYIRMLSYFYLVREVNDERLRSGAGQPEASVQELIKLRTFWRKPWEPLSLSLQLHRFHSLNAFGHCFYVRSDARSHPSHASEAENSVFCHTHQSDRVRRRLSQVYWNQVDRMMASFRQHPRNFRCLRFCCISGH